MSTPQLWRLPTPFQDQSGGRITVPLHRPTPQSIAFLVVLLHLADELVTRTRFEHDELTAGLTYAMCVILAWTGAALLRRIDAGERIARWSVAVVGGIGICVSATPPFTRPELARLAVIALVVVVSAAGEAGYRLTAKPTGSPVADPPAPAPPSLTSVDEIHAARTRLVDGRLALDRAISTGEPVPDETVRVLRAEIGGIGEEAAICTVLLERLEAPPDTGSRDAAPASRDQPRGRRGPGRRRAGRNRGSGPRNGISPAHVPSAPATIPANREGNRPRPA
jgi:hypothetical protein